MAACACAHMNDYTCTHVRCVCVCMVSRWSCIDRKHFSFVDLKWRYIYIKCALHNYWMNGPEARGHCTIRWNVNDLSLHITYSVCDFLMDKAIPDDWLWHNRIHDKWYGLNATRNFDKFDKHSRVNKNQRNRLILAAAKLYHNPYLSAQQLYTQQQHSWIDNEEPHSCGFACASDTILTRSIVIGTFENFELFHIFKFII